MPELIRKRQAAELLGVSAPRISQLLQAGHLSEVAGTGMLSRADVEAFAQSRVGVTTAVVHPRSSSTAAEPQMRRAAPPASPAMPVTSRDGLPSIAESRQRLEALKAAIAQHDLDTRRGKLVSRDEVARAAFQEGQRIRQALEVTLGEVMPSGEPHLRKRRRELTRQQAIKLWTQKRRLGWRVCGSQWSPQQSPRVSEIAAAGSA